MIEDRITNLEIKLSFTEDLIEQLNQTVYKQQQQIEFLYRELKSVKELINCGVACKGKNDREDFRRRF